MADWALQHPPAHLVPGHTQHHRRQDYRKTRSGLDDKVDGGIGYDVRYTKVGHTQHHRRQDH